MTRTSVPRSRAARRRPRRPRRANIPTHFPGLQLPVKVPNMERHIKKLAEQQAIRATSTSIMSSWLTKTTEETSRRLESMTTLDESSVIVLGCKTCRPEMRQSSESDGTKEIPSIHQDGSDSDQEGGGISVAKSPQESPAKVHCSRLKEQGVFDAGIFLLNFP